ncbi:hypothetical protein N783_04860 [Pontibacillus marinus BH030004 = DSM 16465]|uniref:Uncharacterized protein n=1 Tax=Pontibacillus marinus BH030004 = DSM 16465 TaxID=1385511 RepID=A0A0A5G968_9BACI|nr:hypothetical protein N783_04860 [Pontibacillus marinus BH030004 = DSM 16465]
MNLGDLVYLFFIYLLIVCIGSFLVGFFIMRKFKSHTNGFNTLIGISLLFLIFLFRWFQSNAADLFMGTIPWLFNQLFAIGLYILYLIVAWFLLRTLHKRGQRNR